MLRLFGLLQIVLFAAMVPSADAQPAVGGVRGAVEKRFGRDRDEKPRPKKWQAKGKVHSISRDAINVITDSGEPWQVKISKSTNVSVTGQGGAELLKPEVVVRFSAVLNKRGVASEPLEEITVMSPRDGFQPSAELASGDESKGESTKGKEEKAEKKEKPKKLKSPKPLTFSGPSVSISGVTATKDKDKDQVDKPGERYEVVGILSGIRKGRITVSVGKKKFKARMADDAKVMADFTSHAMAKPGDLIEIAGMALPKEAQRGKFGKATATTAKITITPPAPKKEKKGRRSRRKEAEEEEA